VLATPCLPAAPILLTFLLLLVTPATAQTTRTVALDDSGQFTSIQAAIEASSDGDLVEVAPGTYEEAIDFCGRDIQVYSTGGVDATVITPPPGVPAVSFVHQEGPEARLSGFTITGADTSAILKEPPGAGIHVSYACPTLTNLRIEGNRAYFGGGIKIKYNAHPLLQRVEVVGNTAESCGGGIYICESSPTLIDVEVRDNLAIAMNGGGLVLGKGSYPHLHRMLVEGNSAAIHGGGIYMQGEASEGKPVDALLSQVTLVGNRGNLGGQDGHGANLFLQLAARATVVDAIVAGGLGGEGIYSLLWDPANPPLQVTYSTFWNNASGDVVSGSHGELTGVVADVGNLVADPLFADADAGDYQLAEGSPCIDAGDPELEDPDGSPADMGAYGGPWEVPHDTEDCLAGQDGDPCAPPGDDDDSADVVYKKCVCSASGVARPPAGLAALGLLLLMRRRARRCRTPGGGAMGLHVRSGVAGIVTLSATTLLFLAVGCRPPLEEAPEQIDDPIQYFFVQFEDPETDGLEQALATYTEFLIECQETVQDDGSNERPECDLEEGLSTAMITDAELGGLLDAGTLAALPTEEEWEQAVSIVVAREMPTTAEAVEGVLMLPNQDEVFPQFETYERTFLTSQDDYLAGDERFLRTRNEVVSNYVLDVTATYRLFLDFQQIDWDDGEQVRRVVIIRSWFYDDAELSLSGATVGFTFSIEILIPTTDDPSRLWRTQGLWSHADLPLDGDDHAFWENQLRDGTIDGFDQLQAWIDEH